MEKPAYEKFDLEIKNDEELEEAKKEADVKNQEQAIKDEADFAAENNDELLFNKSDDRLKKIEEENNAKKRYEIAVKKIADDKIVDAYLNISKEDKEMYSKRLRVIFDGIVKDKNIELGNDDSIINVMDRAFAILDEEIQKDKGAKKYKGSYVIEKGVVDTDIDKFRKDA